MVKGMNLLSLRVNSFLNEQPLYDKGGKYFYGRVTFLGGVSVYLRFTGSLSGAATLSLRS